MKEIFCQVINKKLHPFSEADIELIREYKPNQVVRCEVYGVKKPRSLLQLRLYWATCGVVAENTENPQWDTKGKVDFQNRVALHFVDPDTVAVRPDGHVVYKYRSIAFRNLQHIEACNYFNRSFKVMADFLGVDDEKLIEMVKER